MLRRGRRPRRPDAGSITAVHLRDVREAIPYAYFHHVEEVRLRKLVIFTAAFALSAAVYVYGFRSAAALWLAGAFLVLSPLAGKLRLRRCSIAALGLAAGLLLCFAYQQIYLKPLEPLYGTEQTITLTLTETPTSHAYGTYATGTVRVNGRSYPAVLYADLLEAQPGDRVTGEMILTAAQEDDLYLRSHGTLLRLEALSPPTIEDGDPPWPTGVRLWLQSQLHRFYTGDALGLVQALLTGDRSAMSDAVSYDLSAAGLSHAVAVSGLHVSILLSILVFLCGGNPRLSALLGIPTAIAFALVTGLSPSACRAAVMQILLLSAPLIRREHDTPTSLSAAALVLLLQNPWVIANVSFQLSFAAVAGLLLFSGPIQRRILALQKKPTRLLRFLASSISASFSATALTMPLVIYYFRQLSLAAPIVNLLVLWAVSIILVLGLFSCILGGFGAVIVQFLSNYVLSVARWTAAFPYSAAHLADLPLLIWGILAYGVAYYLLLCKKSRPLLPLCALTLSFLGCILWGRWSWMRELPAYHLLDVGQGQCTLFQTETFTAVLDCGGVSAGETLIGTLHSGGQTHLDALLVTHYDADHAGGASLVLHALDVGVVFLPDIPDPTGVRQSIETAAAEQNTQVVFVRTLTETTFSGGKLTIYPPVSEENDNNSGICVLATAEEYDILLTGDLDQFSEMRLLSRFDLPQVEVLVAGHHGAANSTSSILLETVRPETVAISVGENNQYNHPAQETLTRIPVPIHRTDLEGHIILHP